MCWGCSASTCIRARAHGHFSQSSACIVASVAHPSVRPSIHSSIHPSSGLFLQLGCSHCQPGSSVQRAAPLFPVKNKPTFSATLFLTLDPSPCSGYEPAPSRRTEEGRPAATSRPWGCRPEGPLLSHSPHLCLLPAGNPGLRGCRAPAGPRCPAGSRVGRTPAGGSGPPQAPPALGRRLPNKQQPLPLPWRPRPARRRGDGAPPLPRG